MPALKSLASAALVSAAASICSTAGAQQQPPPVPTATGTATASAQPPPPAAAPEPAEESSPIRLTIDLHLGLTYRMPAGDGEQPGGVLVGGNVLVGPLKWLAFGAGFEHGWLNRNDDADPSERFFRKGRLLEALWFHGRVYPYENDVVALYAQLSAGPAWQQVSANVAGVAGGGASPAIGSSSCSAVDSAALGLRGGVGVEVPISVPFVFTGELGAQHMFLSSDPIGGCGKGAGPSTLLGARIGLAFITGRNKKTAEPAPPPPPDTDRDGILDSQDGCPLVAGVPSLDPQKNGCPPDRDGDTIADAQDSCPDVPGVPSLDPQKNGCPPDRDGDTIIDAQDGCPDVPGEPNADPQKNGCPPDRDGDNVPDAQDACPDTKGVATTNPATHGCPPDTDGDTIRDDKDACPAVKGVPSDDPTKHGCPLVQFTEKEIVIAQQVQFEVNKAIIRPESNSLLDEVATVIKEHPEIVTLEVQGHTDNSGTKQHNKTLSLNRAIAVRKALVERGIAGKVLQARGYGDEMPIADNATEAGKAKNRRVVFKILEKKEKAEAAPK